MSFPLYEQLHHKAQQEHSQQMVLSPDEARFMSAQHLRFSLADLETIQALITYHASRQGGYWINATPPYNPEMTGGRVGPKYNFASLPALLLRIIYLFVLSRVGQ